MRVLTREEIFDGLYAAAAADGRGSALFGDSGTGARTFFDRSLLQRGFPVVYLEFPLKGAPGLDLLAIYEHVAEGASFAPGTGYGYQDIFEWFSRAAAPGASIGLELDLSSGVTDQAGIYLQHHENLDLGLNFLRHLGEEARAATYAAQASRMPRGWAPAYVGLFPARAGSPMRMGGYLSEPSRRRCASDPAFLGSRFDLMGFEAYDTKMLERCSLLMDLVPGVDFQFDLMADGLLSPTFGLSLSFGRLQMQDIRDCFTSGYGCAVMRTFEEWGLADARWHHIANAPLARCVEFENDRGEKRRMLVCIRLNYAKLKFVNAVPQTAKFYLVLLARDLEDAAFQGAISPDKPR